jgi:hypothetical protein
MPRPHKEADPRYARSPRCMIPRLSNKLAHATTFAAHIEARTALAEYAADKSTAKMLKKVQQHLAKAHEALRSTL